VLQRGSRIACTKATTERQLERAGHTETEERREEEQRAKLGGRGTVARKIDEPEGLVVGAMVVERALAAGAASVKVDRLRAAGCRAAFGERSGGGAVLGWGCGNSEGIEQRRFP
jgi:hypothetical protein